MIGATLNAYLQFPTPEPLQTGSNTETEFVCRSEHPHYAGLENSVSLHALHFLFLSIELFFAESNY